MEEWEGGSVGKPRERGGDSRRKRGAVVHGWEGPRERHARRERDKKSDGQVTRGERRKCGWQRQNTEGATMPDQWEVEKRF